MTTEPKHGLKRYRVNSLPGRVTRDCPEVVLASEADALIAAKDAEIAGLREALGKIKTLCVGDAFPNWENTPRTYQTRGIIADVVDLILGHAAPAASRRSAMSEKVKP